jgi:hypothetical protein
VYSLSIKDKESAKTVAMTAVKDKEDKRDRRASILKEPGEDGSPPKKLVLPPLNLLATLRQLYTDLFSLTLMPDITPRKHSDVLLMHRWRSIDDLKDTYLKYFPFLKV